VTLDHGLPGRARRHARPTSRGRNLQTVGKVLAALVSSAVLVGFGYGWYEYRSLDSGLQKFHLTHLGQPAPGATASAQRTPGKEQNILLVGLDSRDGLSHQEQKQLKVGSDPSLATDTILILHIPADGRRATMISIPRDSYVDIPHYAKNKINAAYADAYSDAVNAGASVKQAEAAGADLLVETVSDFTGLEIDHYVQVGFGGFYTIAKALKTVPVTLCAATDDSLARNRAENQQGGSGFKMSAGHHDLTPVQALEFVRQRHFIQGGDLAREKRQRYFIAAAFNKIASAGTLLDPGKLDALIKAVTGAFYVDDNHFSMIDFANQLIDLSANNITGYTIPTHGTHDVDVVGTTTNVVRVNPDEVRKFVAAHLDPQQASHPATGSATPTGSASGSATGSGAGSSGTAAPAAKGCVY
jgi:LCP family protein required for cell wall assembly